MNLNSHVTTFYTKAEALNSKNTPAFSKHTQFMTEAQEIEYWLCAGGDERLQLKTRAEDPPSATIKRNKYFVNPIDYRTVFHRGSCTCSPLTPSGHKSVIDIYERACEEPGAVIHEQRERLKGLFRSGSEPNHFEVFFAPSGSDLCYYPLLFARLIAPESKIVNLVTRPTELGSGSILAHQGQYYFGRSQFGEKTTIGQTAPDLSQFQLITFPARLKSGDIADHRSAICEAIDATDKSDSILVNLVLGSKSGIADPIEFIDELQAKYSDRANMMFIVDVCQFRVSPQVIRDLLAKHCLVMITGSKFYQGPPFSGALLVPHAVTGRFQSAQLEQAQDYQQIFSRFDIPESMAGLGGQLPEQANLGLILRWEAALSEMERFQQLDPHAVDRVVREWNDLIFGIIEREPCFELMPGTGETEPTIVSFRVKNGDHELDYNALKALYNGLCGRRIVEFPDFQRILFGQPVRYGQRAFIRVALGAENIRMLMTESAEPDFQYDQFLMKLIAKRVKS